MSKTSRNPIISEKGNGLEERVLPTKVQALLDTGRRDALPYTGKKTEDLRPYELSSAPSYGDIT